MQFEVLILGTDANAYYMARCCYEAYHKKAYLIGKDRLAFTKYSNILEVSYIPNLWDVDTFITTLNNFAKEHKGKKILLVSTNETYAEYISEYKEKLSPEFVYNLPSTKVLKSLTNKETFYETYKKSSLQFPKTLYYDCRKKEKIPKLTYPIVIKPANVVMYNHLKFEGKNKIYRVNSEKETKEILKIVSKAGYKDKMILQEFIPGDDSNLFDAVLYVNTKGKVEFVSFAQIGLQERTKSMVGNAAVLINGFNTTNGDTLKMANTIKDFMEQINYRGFAEVDMKYDIRDNTFKVLEINARQGRSSYYVSALGKNLIKVLESDCLKRKSNKFQVLDKKVLLSFVPRGIIKKYISNEAFKKEALGMWKSVIKPMDAPSDKNIKRFFMLRKRWFHYYKEYKNSYWEGGK